MRIRKGFVLRQVADSYMVVPVGSEAGKLRGVIAMNETAARIWKELEQENTTESIRDKLSEEYDIPAQELYSYIVEFTDLLRQKELLE